MLPNELSAFQFRSFAVAVRWLPHRQQRAAASAEEAAAEAALVAASLEQDFPSEGGCTSVLETAAAA